MISPATAGRIGRRDVLKAGRSRLPGPCSAVRAGRAAGQTTTAPAKPRAAHAKAVILVYLAGGISQVESFDPKPENGKWNGPKWFKTIATNVPGIEVSEGIPRLAKVADKYSIIRSMTHPVAQFHGIANYVMTTGTIPSNDIVYPSAGAIIALKKGDPASVLPPYVFLTEPGCVFTEESFLPPFCAPYATGGDPASTRVTRPGWRWTRLDSAASAGPPGPASDHGRFPWPSGQPMGNAGR